MLNTEDKTCTESKSGISKILTGILRSILALKKSVPKVRVRLSIIEREGQKYGEAKSLEKRNKVEALMENEKCNIVP